MDGTFAARVAKACQKKKKKIFCNSNVCMRYSLFFNVFPRRRKRSGKEVNFKRQPKRLYKRKKFSKNVLYMYVKQKGLKFGDTENAYKTIQCFLNQMFIISDLTRRNTAAFKVQGGRSRDARERSAEENRKTRSEDLFYKYAKE